MHGPAPDLHTEAVSGSGRGPFLCFVGRIEPVGRDPSAPEGEPCARLITPVGVVVPVLQSLPALINGESLTSYQKTVTVCGTLVFHRGGLALDAAYVSPGVNTATPGVSPLALVVLALLGLLPAVD